jgi:hexosaminidase
MLVVALSGAAPAAETAAAIALLPQPREVQCGPGQFVLKQGTAILVDKDSPDAASIAKLLARRIQAGTGLELKVSNSDGPGKQPGSIRMTTRRADASLGSEGYRLEVTPEGALITAGGAAGMFYGTQTLLQLLPPGVFSTAKVQEPVAWAVPAVRISDRPRFVWRGLLLDVARHFFNKEELKNFIDLMAQYKLNTLQIHLTDDQGWRVQIKRYPRLTEVGAWRNAIGFGFAAGDGTAYGKDGRYGGFYTQDDVRDLVAYAKARYVTIVPEIEMPGHSAAALSAYPEYSCFGGPYNRDSGPMGIYCPGNDATFTFLENVLREVMDLFPGKYLHIGADEVAKGNWTRCPKCKARIEREGLKSEHELQSYFVKRIERFINAQGRALIGWDEILEGGLAPNATVMSWRGIEGGVTAAKAGHDVIMTPTGYCYLDYCQAKRGEPRAIGGFLPLVKVYGYDPLPPGLPPGNASHVLGAGGNLWSEFFPNYAQVQYMAYPRACAIAELTWTDPKQKNWDDFKRRVQTQLERLKVQGVHYRAPKKDDAGW